jgi:hypothetical protein
MTCFTGRSKNIRSGGDLASTVGRYNGLTGTGQKAVARNKNLSPGHIRETWQTAINRSRLKTGF